MTCNAWFRSKDIDGLLDTMARLMREAGHEATSEDCNMAITLLKASGRTDCICEPVKEMTASRVNFNYWTMRNIRSALGTAEFAELEGRLKFTTRKGDDNYAHVPLKLDDNLNNYPEYSREKSDERK